MNNITAVIVTYNRKQDLLRCVQAVLSQTQPLTSIIIVDNASKDNTFGYIYQQLYNCAADQIPQLTVNNVTELPMLEDMKIYYEYEEKNGGGAGGFCRGMEIADKLLHSDYIWMMDDDGYPDSACLEKLIFYTDKYDYISAVSIDITDHAKLAWPLRRKNKIIADIKTLYEWYGSGPLVNVSLPFNGLLLSSYCIKKAGYVKKEFFIYGDEIEHLDRCKKKRIKIATVLDALFYHPANKNPFVNILGGLFKIRYVESELRFICFVRNSTYIYYHYKGKIKIVILFFLYSWFFLITRKFDLKGYKLYLASVWDGLRGDFTRHLKYL